jgi:predicted dehydrogenase
MHRREFLRTGGIAAAALLGSRPLFAAGEIQRLRVVQIGTSHSHAPEKWTTLGRLSDLFDVAGIWEPSEERRERAALAPEYRGARWLKESEVFGDRSIRAALVETELPDQLAMARRVLAAGWHLHLDKPAGTDLAAFAALQQAADRDGRVLQLGYMLRHHPAIQFCFEAHRQGWLGNLVAIHGDMGKVIGPRRRPWLADNYGGSMMLLGCHLIDLVVALLGTPQSHTTHRRRTFPERDKFYDHEMAVLEYPRVMATVRSLLVEAGGEERRQFVLCGERGTIEVLPLEPAHVRMYLTAPAGEFREGWQDVALPRLTGRYDDMMHDFAARVAGHPSAVPLFTPAHDLRAQETLLAVAARPGAA